MNKIKIISLVFLFVILSCFGLSDIAQAKATEIDTDENPKYKVLEVTKTNNPEGEVSPGTEILYTITVKNISHRRIGPVIVSDHWDFEGDETATYVQGSASGDADVWEGDQRIYWIIKKIKPGKEVSVSYKLRVDPVNDHKGTFTIINRVCAKTVKIDPCDKVENTVTYKESPKPTSSSSKSKTAKKILSTSTIVEAGGTSEPLPVTGADYSLPLQYLIGFLSFTGFAYFIKFVSLKNLGIK